MGEAIAEETEKEKTSKELSTQISRVTKKLGERALGLPQDVVDSTNKRGNELDIYGSKGEDPLYVVTHRKGDSKTTVTNLLTRQGEGAEIKKETGNAQIRIDADPGYDVDARLEQADDDGSLETVEKFDQDKTVHETASALSDLRGEIASREIASSQKK